MYLIKFRMPKKTASKWWYYKVKIYEKIYQRISYP